MIEEKKNNVFKNFFSLVIVQIITSLLQLVVIPYVIKKIGVDGFGIIAVAQVIMFYLSAFTEYGFAQTATKEISIYRDDRVMISRIFFRVFFSRLFLCALSFLLLLILILFIPLLNHHWFLYIAAFVFVLGQAVLINWFFTGMEKMRLMAITNLIARLIFVVLVFLFIRSKEDGIFYLFFLGAGNFMVGLGSVFFTIHRYHLQFIRPEFSEIKSELREGWQITATNLLNNVCQYSNVFILRLFTNDLVTGYYSVAERVFLTLRQLLGVFSQTVYPQVCLIVSNGREKVGSYFKKNYLPFLSLFASGCVLLFFAAPWTIYFFIRHESGNSAFLLRIFAIVLLIVCLNLPAALLLLATDQRKSYFRVYSLAVIINVILNLFLAYFFQSAGTVIAILLTEFFITIALTRELRGFNLVDNRQPIHKEKMSEVNRMNL